MRKEAFFICSGRFDLAEAFHALKHAVAPSATIECRCTTLPQLGNVCAPRHCTSLPQVQNRSAQKVQVAVDTGQTNTLVPSWISLHGNTSGETLRRWCSVMVSLKIELACAVSARVHWYRSSLMTTWSSLQRSAHPICHNKACIYPDAFCTAC